MKKKSLITSLLVPLVLGCASNQKTLEKIDKEYSTIDSEIKIKRNINFAGYKDFDRIEIPGKGTFLIKCYDKKETFICFWDTNSDGCYDYYGEGTYIVGENNLGKIDEAELHPIIDQLGYFCEKIKLQ